MICQSTRDKFFDDFAMPNMHSVKGANGHDSFSLGLKSRYGMKNFQQVAFSASKLNFPTEFQYSEIIDSPQMN